MKAGKLEMIVGGMFSGKSTELQRRGKRNEIAGRKVLYFKPSIDDRYKAGAISTHDGNNIEANVTRGSKEILYVARKLKPEVVCIDEIQFYDDMIESTINLLLVEGIDVIASGLDMDRFGTPFGKVPELLCKAEEVTKLKAVCTSCGEDAWLSVGNFESTEQNVIGEKESYTAMCRTCFYQKGGIL